MTNRRLFIIASAVWPASMNAAHGADPYPSTLLRLISPAPAGGIADAFTRIVSECLSSALGRGR